MKNNIYLISAVDKNWGIGIDTKLPWSIKEEMDYFRETTSNGNNCVVMGATTADSIPNMPLKDRDNYVIDFNEYHNKECTTLNGDWQARVEELSDKYDKVFIIGGASIYKQAIDSQLIDVVMISRLKKEYNCNIFFPKDGLSEYDVRHIEPHNAFDTEFYFKKNNDRCEKLLECMTLISEFCHTNDRYKYEFYEYIDKMICSTLNEISNTGEEDE